MNNEQRLTEIRLKVIRLLEERDQLRKKMGSLEAELRELNASLDTEKNSRRKLEEQNKIAKIAVSLRNSDTDREEWKKLLDRYIREIDECIRLIGDNKL